MLELVGLVEAETFLVEVFAFLEVFEELFAVIEGVLLLIGQLPDCFTAKAQK